MLIAFMTPITATMVTRIAHLPEFDIAEPDQVTQSSHPNRTFPKR
jgi:hypothetical protein